MLISGATLAEKVSQGGIRLSLQLETLLIILWLSRVQWWLSIGRRPGERQILVTGHDAEGGWLMSTDGEGVAGSVSISTCDAVVDGYPGGWVGVEAKRGAVEVFHGFCDYQETEHAPGERMEVPTAIGYLDTGRAVRIVEMVNDRVLVEDLADVDCDMATIYDTYLMFDDERTPRDFDDRRTEEKTQVHILCTMMPAVVQNPGSGCVVDMWARSVNALVEKSVRRSAVWLSVDCLCKHTVSAQFEVDSTS